MVLDSAQLEIHNDKLSTTDTSDTEGKSGTWFWNESANESDSDIEGGEDEEVDENESDLDVDQPRTERAVSTKVQNKELKWNREGKEKLRGA